MGAECGLLHISSVHPSFSTFSQRDMSILMLGDVEVKWE